MAYLAALRAPPPPPGGTVEIVVRAGESVGLTLYEESLRVKRVDTGSPAEEAGVIGDGTWAIVYANGSSVATPMQLGGILKRLASARKGTTITVRLQREPGSSPAGGITRVDWLRQQRHDAAAIGDVAAEERFRALENDVVEQSGGEELEASLHELERLRQTTRDFLEGQEEVQREIRETEAEISGQ